MDLHEILSIGPQWANKYEVTLNLTQPHLPSFVMTYHDLPNSTLKIHQGNFQTSYSSLCLLFSYFPPILMFFLKAKACAQYPTSGQFTFWFLWIYFLDTLELLLDLSLIHI